ncbi:FMN-binding protein [Anaerococcus ihuae]|uniref:FMN-binding protein n=1 Tax=Anaerococcus ihuae TaxID=2899519 RepID=UPI001F01C5E2|nr:FMN-binding protein [Anaerococcus ihuae]
MKNTFLKKVLTFIIVGLASMAMIKSSMFVLEKNKLAAEKKDKIVSDSARLATDLKDGQYEASSEGYGGLLTVRITVKNGKLTDIKILSHNETEEYFKKASAIIKEILRTGKVDVDSVTGATISSNAIKDAVLKALQKAGSKEKIKEKAKKEDKKPVEGLKDGEYFGSANGYGGNLTVKVIIKNGKISGIEVVSQNETPEYFNRAYAVINKILSSGSVNVDSVTGATVSSNAIKMAVADALHKAGSKENAKVQAVNKASSNNKRANAKGTVAIGNKDLKDGVYTGSGQGFNGPIRVRVTISKGSITNVEILSHSDDNPYFGRARSVISKILGKADKSVDTVSGATYSSRGILDAVRNALSKAGGSKNVDNKNKKPSNTGQAKKPNKKPEKPSKDNKIYKQYKDGVYEGVAEGFNGPIKVKVTIAKGSITKVEILSHKEDDPYFSKSKGVISKMLGKPGKNVDTVSGATFSSKGIIDAINNAVSKAGIENSPSKPDKKPDQQKPEEDKKPEKPSEEKIDDALKKYYNDQPLKDGEYTGWGIGYINTRKIRTYIKVENGEISEIRVGENSEYGDDMGPFRQKAEKVLSFIKGKDGRLNLAKMGLYREYFETIRKSSNPKAKALELFGAEYANNLNGYRNDNSESDLTLISRTVKAYMSKKYKSKELFDSVTGATVSASGISSAAREATKKSSNDYITNSDVKEITITAPKNKNIEVNKGDGVDFTEMKVNLIKKDGSQKEVEWKDFKENGISITDENGKTIENGSDLKNYANKKIIKAKVMHQKSLSYDDFRILIGKYSKDYIIGLEYSADGNKWYKVDKVEMDYVDKRNISDHQVIDAPTSFEFEKVKLRAVSKNGNRYEYTGDKLPVNRQVKYTLLKEENPNTPKTIYVNFQLSGEESDKNLVEEKEKEEKPKPQEEEIEVDQKVIDTSLMESNGQQWIEGKEIRPATVTSLDKDAEILKEIDGLPKGLIFDGKTITGIPEPSNEGWPEDGSGFKTITLKFKAKKKGKLLVRKITYWLYRDKDRDGISDDEDKDHGEKFTPQRSSSKPIIVEGKAPSLEEYKERFSNIPKDGSVEVSFKNKPDYSKVSEVPQRVYLQFKSKGTKEVGEAYVMVIVKKAVEKEEKPKPQEEEIEVDQKVIDTSLMESNGQQWIEGKEIRPATVTSLDKDAEILKEIDGLPKGLIFDGKTITGIPEPSNEGWPEDGSGFKTITLKFKAKKKGKLLVRKITYWLYRDKDRDGISDDEDKDHGEKFTPQRSSSKPIIVEGKAPSLEEYKERFSNIPKDGSVEVSFKNKPDYSKVSEVPQRVYLQFKSKGTKEVGEAYVMVIVKKAVKKENSQDKPSSKKAIKKKENSKNKIEEKPSLKPSVNEKKYPDKNESNKDSGNKELEKTEKENTENEKDSLKIQSTKNSQLPPLEKNKEEIIIDESKNPIQKEQ